MPLDDSSAAKLVEGYPWYLHPSTRSCNLLTIRTCHRSLMRPRDQKFDANPSSHTEGALLLVLSVGKSASITDEDLANAISALQGLGIVGRPVNHRLGMECCNTVPVSPVECVDELFDNSEILFDIQF